MNASLRAIVNLVVESLQKVPSNASAPEIKGVGQHPPDNISRLFKLYATGLSSLAFGGWLANVGAAYLDAKGLAPSDDDDDD